jgi:hypothetical protein
MLQLQRKRAAAASQPPLTFHSFSKLPPELKRYILRERLIWYSPMSTRIHLMVYAPALIRIASVNQEMRAIALETYYGQNFFTLGRCIL